MKPIVIILLCVIAITTSGCVSSGESDWDSYMNSGKEFCQKHGYTSFYYGGILNMDNTVCVLENKGGTEIIETRRVKSEKGVWLFVK